VPFPFLAIGAGLALAGAAGRFFGGVKQKKEARKINPVFNQYQANPLAKKQLGLAQNMFAGRMAGAPALERNIFSSQANTLDSISRNATDASQALALASGTQGSTNEALSNLQNQELLNKQMMLQNLNQAYGTNIREGDKEYESMLQKYMMDSQRKDALTSSGAQNKYGAISDLSSMAFTLGMGNFGNGGGSGRGFNIPYNNNPMQTLPYGGASPLPGLMKRRTPNFGG
jgi:hypothetical protein